VIASRTGAFEHIVEPEHTGLLVPTDDAKALANALRYLMSDPEKAVDMGRLGRERVAAKFSIEQEALGIQSVYQLINQ
jgi:mannosyltransferase